MKAYEEVSLEPLSFRIGGKTYVVPPVSIRAAQTLRQIFADDKAGKKSKLASEELFRLAMTDDLWDLLLANDVPADAAWRAGMAALADFQQGRGAAEALWEAGTLDPERLAAFMAARQQVQGQKKPAVKKAAARPAKPRASTRSRSSAAASKTR